MRVFSPIIEPVTAHLASRIADQLHRRAIGPQAIGHDNPGRTIPFHGLLQESQCRLAIPFAGDKHFENFALMINRSPQVMRLTADLHEHLIEVPAPLRPVSLLNPAP